MASVAVLTGATRTLRRVSPSRIGEHGVSNAKTGQVSVLAYARGTAPPRESIVPTSFDPPDVLDDGRYILVKPAVVKGGHFAPVVKYADKRPGFGGRTVAVKFLDYSAAWLAPVEEVQRTATLKGGNIVTVYEFLDPNQTGRPRVWGMVMEFIDGETLLDIVTAGRSVSPLEAADWARQIANGLTTLHAAGLSHADLHLSNVMVEQDRTHPHGRLVIIDLGVSALLGQPARGKQLVRAPEASTATMPQSDFWSLGLIVAQLAAGRLLWPADGARVDAIELRAAALALVEEAQSPLAELVMELLTMDPYERAGLDEVEKTVDALRRNVAPAPPTPKPQRSSKRKLTRREIGNGALLSAGVGALAAAGYLAADAILRASG